jgi:uncharacterized phage protein (TIGR01671 family)
MREILFRGKRVYNGEWLAGDLLANKYERPNICPIGDVNCYPVIPETVGQYTGMKDKNGEKIFEGDIVKYSTTCEIFTVAWHGSFAEFVISELQKPNKATRGSKDMYLVNRYCEVIGNIYDNPELLEGEENE